MTDATLQHFRDLASAMQGDAPRDWQWTGPWISQRRFGIPQAEAESLAERYGGHACEMIDAPSA